MSAKLNIVTDSRQAVFAVPYGALAEDADGNTIIYAIDENAASGETSGTATEGSSRYAIPVTTGLETDYYVEISAADTSGGTGLKDGLLIIADPEGLTSEEAPENPLETNMGGPLAGE
jgi:hypothetical protein